MAEYRVPGPDGKTYTLRGPEGLPMEVLQMDLQKHLALRSFADRPAPPPPAPERSTMLEEVKRSARGLASGARTGIEALLGDPEQSALEGIRRSNQISEDYGTAPSFAGLKDTYQNEGILAALGEGLSQVPRFVAQQAPVLAQLAAAGKTGAALMPIPTLKPLAGAITAGASFIPSFTGSNLERLAEEQMASGDVVDVDLGGAALTATGQAATEALGGAAVLGKRIVSSLLGQVPQELAEQELKKMASRGTLASIAAAGARGAAVEMPTEVIQSMLERNYAGLPLADEEAMREYGEAAYAAGLSGGAISGALGSRDGARARRELEQRLPVVDEQAPVEPEVPPITPAAPADVLPTDTELTLDDLLNDGAQARTDAGADTFYPRGDLDRESRRDRGRIREMEDDLTADLNRVEEAPAAPVSLEPTLDEELAQRGQEQATRAQQDQAAAQAAAQQEQLRQDEARKQSITNIESEFEQARRERERLAREGQGEQGDMFPQAEAAPPSVVVDVPTLKSLGVSPRATIMKQVEGKDINDPAQRQEVIGALRNYIANPTVRERNPEARRGVMRLITQLSEAPIAPEGEAPTQLPLQNQIAENALLEQRQSEAQRVQAEQDAAFAAREQELADKKAQEEALAYVGKSDAPTAMKTAMRRAELATAVEVSPATAPGVAAPREQAPAGDVPTLRRELDRSPVNSANQPIANNEEGVRNFWNWFGDSKAVDAEGKPLVLYHGTSVIPENSNVISTKQAKGSNRGAWFGLPGTANMYARGPGANVNPVYLSIKNPTNSLLDWNNDSAGKYDGFIGEFGPGQPVYAVRNNTQIKSAVGNKGTFDPAKPGIVDSGSIETKENSNATKEINRSFTRALNETQTSQELLGRIANDKLVPAPLRALARALRSAAPNVNVPVNLTEMEGYDVVGQYIPPWEGTERIILDPRAGSVPQTYLHEFVHALTVRAIAEDTPAGQRVKALFEQFKKKHPDVLDPDTGKMKPFMYGLKNAYEFISEGLTNPNFQVMLKQKNLWQRFVDAIRQLVGLPASQNHILDELLDLTKEMAVGADARFIAKRNELADAFADSDNPAGNETFLRVQGEMLKDASVTENDPKFKRAVSTFMGSGSSATRRVLAWGLPLPALNDYVQNHFKKKGSNYVPLAESVDRFTKIAHKMEGELEQFTVAITAQLARMGQWRNENPTKIKTLGEVYFGGRLALIDVTKPRSYYEGKKDESEMSDKGIEWRKARLKDYDRLHKLFVDLGPNGQAVLRQMRAIHNGQFKKLSQMVYDRVYSDTQDRELATRLKNEFTKQMREKGPMEGYAAFQRPNGKYMLQYPVPGNPEPAFEIFTNEFDQKARMDQLEEDGVRRMDMKPFLGDDLKNFDGVVPTSFMGKLVQELKDSKLDKDSPAYKNLVESVMSLGVSMSPSSLVLQRLAKSRNVPGYIQDPIAAFQEGTVGLGKRLVNLKYGAQLSNEVRDMQASRKNVGNDPAALDLVQEMTKRGQYALNPSHAGWSNFMSTATYGWTLGFNLSSAVVDMSALALVTAPFLAKFPGYNYGLAKTAGKISSSMRDIMGMGTTASVESLTTAGLEGKELQETLDLLGKKEGERDMIDRKAMPSMLNIDFTNAAQRQKYGHLESLVKKMQEYGHSERYSEMSEAVEFGEGTALSKWSARMGVMMSASERFKREVGIKAAYELELDRLAPNGKPTQAQMDAAADKAMQMSTLINGGSTAVTGAGFQRGDISRILMMYRRFAAGQLYLQSKMLGVAFAGATPKERAEMRSYMAYSMLTSAAFVGVKGMPLMGAAASAYAVAMMLFGDEDEDNSFENMLRNNMDPIFVEGVPNILFNANVAGRMELTNLLIRNSSVRDGATFAEYAAAYMGGPAVGSMERIWRGARMVNDGDIQRGVENMLPVTLSNALKALRVGAEGQASTLRGDEVVPVTPGGALAQMMGFAPADYARAIELNIKQSGVDRRMAARRTALMEAVYIAYRAGDTEGVARAMQKIVAFNQEYPNHGITSQGIRQSLATRDRNTAKMVMGSLPAERRRDSWEEEAAAWGFE